MRPFFAAMLFTCLAFHQVPAYAQASAYEADIFYGKPPSRKMPAAFTTYDVTCVSNLPKSYEIFPGALALTFKLYKLKRVLTGYADLHLHIIVGDSSSPAVIDPEISTNEDNMVINGSIYMPVYFKLTDAKGMIYEEDSSIISSRMPFSYAMAGSEGFSKNQYSNLQEMLDNTWEVALTQNEAYINDRLNELFWGASKNIPTRLYAFRKNEKFGLDGMDRLVMDTMFRALNQFGKDQQWAPIQARAESAMNYYQHLLTHLDSLTSSIKSRKDIKQLTMLKYDLWYNLAICALWNRNRRAAEYYFARCRATPDRSLDTRMLEWTFMDVLPLD